MMHLTLNQNHKTRSFFPFKIQLRGKQTVFVCVIAHEQRERETEGGGEREKVCERGELVNKQRRWMSLLKQQLIQAIRGRVEECRRGADTCWVNGSKYRPKAEKSWR